MSNYYVDPAGSDTAPYDTLEKAANEPATVMTYHLANPSDAEVIISPGTYLTDYIGNVPINDIIIKADPNKSERPILPVFDLYCQSWLTTTEMSISGLSFESLICRSSTIQKRGTFKWSDLIIRRGTGVAAATLQHIFSVEIDLCIFEGTSNGTGSALLIDWVNSGTVNGSVTRSIFLNTFRGLSSANAVNGLGSLNIDDCIFIGNDTGIYETTIQVPTSSNCLFYENNINVANTVTLTSPVYTDPLFLNPIPSVQEYEVMKESSCIGGGIDGGNIGFYQGSGFLGNVFLDYYKSIGGFLFGGSA